jgi:nicotinic acid mononucleotide adenylyltransferase
MHPLTNEHPASATEIRRAMAGGVSKDEWLHPDVAMYIRAHRLYAV